MHLEVRHLLHMLVMVENSSCSVCMINVACKHCAQFIEIFSKKVYYVFGELSL